MGADELFTLDELLEKNDGRFPFPAQAVHRMATNGLKILVTGKGSTGKYSSLYDKNHKGLYRADHRIWKTPEAKHGRA